VTPATVRVPIGKVEGWSTRLPEDIVAVEEPVEIRVGPRSLSITMRTPGDDFELAAGFLFAEGVISSASQILRITDSGLNIVVVELSPDAVMKPRPRSVDS
jgi:FdhD protein